VANKKDNYSNNKDEEDNHHHHQQHYQQHHQQIHFIRHKEEQGIIQCALHIYSKYEFLMLQVCTLHKTDHKE
jgi:hypothetical protein